MKKNCILKVLFVLATAFGMVNMLTAYAAEINDLVQLGNYTHYNGLIFDYFESEGADIEGALAIGGESRIGTNGHFDIGAAAAPEYSTVAIGRYDNPFGYPTLLLNGLPAVGNNTESNIHVFGGPVVLNEELEASYTSQSNQITGATKFAASEIVNYFFTDALNRSVHTVGVLERAQTNTNAVLTIREFTGWSVSDRFIYNLSDFIPNNLNTGQTGISAADVLVVNIQDEGHITINSPKITSAFGEYELIIFNFPNAVSANFTGGSVLVDGVQLNTSAPDYWLPEENALLAKYSEKIIWNFPEAESIQIYASGVVGSVLAPHAYLEGRGGSINGMLIADSFVMTNGHELHAFTMNGIVFDFTNIGEAPLSGGVNLYKVDAGQNDIFLYGAKFRLEVLAGSNWESYSSETDSLITNNYGRITVQNLPKGKYRFVELVPPEGYDLPGGDNIYHEFTIDTNNGVETPIIITVENAKMSEPVMDIPLQKVNSLTGAGLENAHFKLYRLDGNQHILVSNEIITDDTGQYIIRGLTQGTYYLFEENAPEGYEINAIYAILKITVFLGQNGLQVQYRTLLNDNIVLVGDGDRIEIPNSPVVNEKSRVVLTKVGDNGLAIMGAEFALYMYENGAWVAYEGTGTTSILVTDAYGHIIIEGLPNGRYKLVEKEVEEGYEIMGDSEFEFIIQDGDIKHEKTIVNHSIEGSLIISKKVSTTGSALSGVIFALYRVQADNAMVQVAQLVTNTNGTAYIGGLMQGTYWLEEIKAPEGYDQTGSSAHTFIIGNNGESFVYHHVLTIENKMITGLVSLNKVDGDDHGITLPGVAFELYQLDHISHVWVRQSGTFKTDADGTLKISGLVPGTYKLLETNNPNMGYEVSEEQIIFSITSSNTHHVTITLENFKQGVLTKTIRIRKLDGETNEQLSGAVFELRKWENSQWSSINAHITTNPQGEAAIEGLYAGRYQLRELDAPAGYWISKEPLTMEFSIAESDGELIFTNIDKGNTYGLITVLKDTLIVRNAKLRVAKAEADTNVSDTAEPPSTSDLDGTVVEYILLSAISIAAAALIIRNKTNRYYHK